MSGKIAWVRADLPESYDERKKLVSSALEAGFVYIILRDEDVNLRRLGKFNAMIRKGDDLYLDDERMGTIVLINKPEDLQKASAQKNKVKHLVIAARDWKVIPLENLIAEFQGSQTKLMAEASTPDEAKLFMETMEVGADGVVIAAKSPAAIRDFTPVAAQAGSQVELAPV
ncbi:3-dehydroquinate synthase II, partial [Methanomassiliicoccus luminyensis]|uniref:3-dehydroquinate synthase II n=1 Tax=Methanomassiliicoccus luminyensis TaxID=1080712 RepID=UPI000363894C